MRFLTPIDTRGYTGKRRWCGPAALALLAGVPLRVAHARLTRTSEATYTSLEGVHDEAMALALRDFHLTMRPVDMHALFPGLIRGPTLRRFAGTARSPHLLLISTWDHYIVGHLTPTFRMLADNWTMRPVEYTSFPKLGRSVIQAWEVS